MCPSLPLIRTSTRHVFSHSQIWACWHIPWLTCSLTHVPALGVHTFTPRCCHDLRAKAMPALIECLSSPSSLWNPRLPSSTLRGSSWGQEPHVWEAAARGVAGLSDQHMVTLPKVRHPWKVDEGQHHATVDLASPTALRFLGRVAPVCKSSCSGSGPELSGQWLGVVSASELTFSHDDGQLLSCESLHMDPASLRSHDASPWAPAELFPSSHYLANYRQLWLWFLDWTANHDGHFTLSNAMISFFNSQSEGLVF